MDPEGTRQSPQDETANDPTTSGLGDRGLIPRSEVAQPQTSSAEKQVPNIPSDAHLSLSHTQSEHFERTSTQKHRSHDGHGRKRAGFNGEKHTGRLTVRERLQPTIDNAKRERDKYARKVLVTGWALNTMIGLQVLLGALTTAISAAVTTVKQAQISTAILGALATLVASYLARARGSGEPDLSILRVKDLEQFLRTAEAFQMDHSHEYPNSENHLGEEVEHLRHRFEELLGNASGARKLSPVGITATQPGSGPEPAPALPAPPV